MTVFVCGAAATVFVCGAAVTYVCITLSPSLKYFEIDLFFLVLLSISFMLFQVSLMSSLNC